MRVRIRGGTVDHGEPPLCSSCSYATVVKGAKLGDEIVACNIESVRSLVRFPVYSCTSYVDRSHPTLWHMEQIAWVLRSDPKRRVLGFVEAKKLSDDERHVLED